MGRRSHIFYRGKGDELEIVATDTDTCTLRSTLPLRYANPPIRDKQWEGQARQDATNKSPF